MTDQKIYAACNLFIASLRALYQVEIHCHWQTSGASFFGNHLLFERIYKSSFDDADLIAERFIGIFGAEACGMQAQAEMIAKLLHKYQGDNYHALALRFEKDVLAFSQQIYDLLEAEEEMTLGIDDALMSIASKREEACYLLQQALAEEELDALD